MKLTQEQLAAIEETQNVIVEACPGSGKTRTLVSKLIKLAKNVSGTSRKVACITYTNAAVYEIEDRLRSSGANWLEDACLVSTIHTFCLNEILSHYRWRSTDYSRGYSVLAPDTETYKNLVYEIVNRLSLSQNAVDKFESLNLRPDGSILAPPEIGLHGAKQFWLLLAKNKFIDFPNVLYQSFKLIENNPGIGRGLSSKFSHFLIDEFQDTTEIQVELLKKIAIHKRSKFFLVGDPHQSIFGFAGGNPELMNKFADFVEAKRLTLSANFRSSSKIIARAEKLLPREPSMVAEGQWKDFHIKPCAYSVSSFSDGIMDYFIPAINALGIPYQECAVLSPVWFSLPPVARVLRENGVPIIGPGARPYKGTHLISRLAEQVCAFTTEPEIHRLRRIQRELFHILSELNGKRQNRILTFEGTVITMRIIREAENLKSISSSAIDWLKQFGEQIELILLGEGLLHVGNAGRLVDSCSQIQADIQRNSDDAKNLSVEDLGLFGIPEKSLKLLTMHRAKGLEFDAVVLISLHDNLIPNKRAHNNLAQLEEAKRLLYVSITRARKVVVCLTELRGTPSRFLSDLDF